jgi:hypothetical protein
MNSNTSRPDTREGFNGCLIIHGESMGGCAAAHVARYFNQVDLLVCDRTFASLDAVAERLMGRWASLCLRYLLFWNSDVVSDYIGAHRCNRVILQDPHDEVIAHPASLRAGLAAAYAYGDNLWKMRSLNHELSVSLAMDLPLPPPTSQAGAIAFSSLSAAASCRLPFPEAVVERFAACLFEIGKSSARSQDEQKIRKLTQTLRSKFSDDCDDDNGSDSDDNDDANSNSEYSRQTNNVDSDNVDDDDNNDNGDNGESKNMPMRGLGHGHGHGHGHILTLPPVGRKPCKCCVTRAPTTGKIQDPKEFLNSYCSQDVHAPRVSDSCSTPIQRIWTSLMRLNNGCGQLLGQSVGKGVDDIRAFLSCMLVWRDGAWPDSSIPDSCTTPAQCLEDLRRLVEAYPSVLGHNSSIQFVINTLEAVISRLVETEEAKGEEKTNFLGTLITLHCGHNGWPGAEALGALEAQIVNLPYRRDRRVDDNNHHHHINNPLHAPV